MDALQQSWTGISGPEVRLVCEHLHVDEPTITNSRSLQQALNNIVGLTDLTFSSSSYGTYHLDSLVLPWRF